MRFRAKNIEVPHEIRMKHSGELGNLAIKRQLPEKWQGEKMEVVYETGVTVKNFATAEWSSNRTR